MNEIEVMTHGIDDTISVLRLSIRVHNALRRSKVKTIRELIAVRESGKLQEVRNLGEKGIGEINQKLARINVHYVKPETSPAKSEQLSGKTIQGDSAVATGVRPPVTYTSRVVHYLRLMLINELRAERLHPNAVVDGVTLD